MPLVKPQPRLPVRTVYGLDIGGDYAAVVRARLLRGRVSFETVYAGAAGNLQEALVPAARQVRLDLSLDRAAVTAALPATDSMLRWLEVPLTVKSKARKVLPSQLDIQLPFPLEKCRYGFPRLVPGGAGLRALAVAARAESIDQRLAHLQQLHFDPHVLDHEGLALWREGLEGAPAPSGDTRIICYLGADYSVWATGNGRELTSVHAARLGARQWANPEQRREWQSRVLRMLGGRAEAEPDANLHWCWAGPGPADEEMKDWLTSVAAVSTVITADEPETFLARGLARRALLAEADAWNYRDGEIEHPQSGAWRQRAGRRTALTGLAAGLLLCVANLGIGGWADQQRVAADSTLLARAQAVTGLQTIPRGQEVWIAEREAETQAALNAPLLRAMNPTVSGDLHGLLQQARVDHWHITSLTLRPGHWTLNGTAADWDTGKRLETKLRTQGWDVVLTRQDAVAVEHVRFSLTARKEAP